MRLLLISLVFLVACDFNFQPECDENCSAGGGDDSFGAGAQ